MPFIKGKRAGIRAHVLRARDWEDSGRAYTRSHRISLHWLAGVRDVYTNGCPDAFAGQ